MTKLVQVDAPGDLPAGYVFDATVDGKTVRRQFKLSFVAIVPLIIPSLTQCNLSLSPLSLSLST